MNWIFTTLEPINDSIKFLTPMIGAFVDVAFCVLLGASMLNVQGSVVVHQLGGAGRGSPEFGDRCIPIVDDLVETIPI